MRHRPARADDRVLPRQPHCSHGACPRPELRAAFARARSRRARSHGSPRGNQGTDRGYRPPAQVCSARQDAASLSASRTIFIALPAQSSSPVPMKKPWSSFRWRPQEHLRISRPSSPFPASMWRGSATTISLFRWAFPAQFDHPRLLQAMDDLVAVCRKHGVAPGFLPPTPESAAHWIRQGISHDQPGQRHRRLSRRHAQDSGRTLQKARPPR